MPVKLSKFVNVNFNVDRKTRLAGSYSKVIAISKSALSPDKTYEDINSFRADYSSSQADIFLAGNTFFGAGGRALRIVQRQREETIVQVLERLEGDDWMVATCLDTIIVSEIQAVSTYLESLPAPNKKIFTTTTQDENAKSSDSEADLATKLGASKYVAMKYSTTNKYADITIGAYLSQIDLSGINTIKDYNFTLEAIKAEEVTSTEYDTLIARNYNFVSNLQGKGTMNFGGNMADGTRIILRFGLIAIENDIAKTLMDYLLTKPNMSDASVTRISNLISSSLNRYVTNNLLKPNKIYTGESDTITYNGNTYDLIQNGQVLTSGYLVFVLPIASLTDADVAEHKAPPVYVYVAEAGVIRKINVEGVVI